MSRRHAIIFLFLFAGGIGAGFLTKKAINSSAAKPISKPPGMQELSQAPGFVPPREQTTETLDQLLSVENAENRLHVLLDAIENTRAEDFPALVTSLLDRFEANDGFREDMRWCLLIAIDRWCSLDADGPAALFKQRFDKNFRGSGLQLELAIYSIAFASAHGQPFDQEKAAAIFADLPFPISLDDLPKYASIGIATRSLTEALRSYREFTSGRVHGEFFNLAKLGNESPAAVIEEIAQFGTEKDRSRLLRGYLEALLDSDPVAAFSVLDTLPDEMKSDGLASRLLNQLGKIDAPAALNQLDRIGADEARQQLKHQLLKQWYAQDPEATMAHILADDQESLRVELLRGNFVSDANLRILDSLSPESLGEIASQNGYAIGLGIGPGALAAWLNANSNLTEQYPNFVGGIATRLAREDPESFRRWIESLPAETFAQVAEPSSGSWAKADPEAAMTRAIQPGSPPELLTTAAGTWDFYQPSEAYQWMEQNLDPKQIGSIATANDSKLIRSWTTRDPAEAARRVMEVLPTGARAGQLPVVIEHWSSIDPAAASAFLSTLPEGGTRDAGVAKLVQNIYRDDPQGARAWANTIQQEGLRKEIEGQID